MKQAIQGEVSGVVQQILVEAGRIQAIGRFTQNELTGCQLIDTGGKLLPGFIDVHVHGGGGAETMDGTMEAYRQICQTHARHGTTALLLTTITESDTAIERALRAYRPELETGGAEVLGFHLEGPFIHPNRPGAQSQAHIKPPSVDRLRRWMETSGGTVRYITLAPELEGADELIDEAQRLGVVVAAGHSNATYKEARRAFARGVQSTTHLFNAMTGLHHRAPGLAGAALDTVEAYVELIADTHHVHPAVMRIAIGQKGVHRVLLITDAIRAAGMPEGTYDLGQQTVTYRNGTVRLPDGTLAGSVLTLDRAVQNLLACDALQDADIPVVTSGNQAALLNLPHGRLAAGHPANLVAVNAAWDVTHTFVRGQLVYQA
ncbi:N-acetylglucosamine-6-phosphate deacetylase [Alicyclobacillus cycloheptanicus]|uniref:N-acetylglucosamine-6-phosphate deacetylase n=1 Tax=Alicyclobacillus cycloheptanicus TaxID=1457 RepID=A0ABT9XHQ6_9BACL|nr:N-acetylglucosamine-6-phosphate deacetylase [Alicyclobacillus cycloheptanicus]MDQ0189850.1 N-acetylglucosamine-6-phosphate deacetylase [Alicyclobacillus cycloheptanicus]WDM02466.1 N-acetylglucosamine-6-phosphate deacetylase [Alicyclobacillus cycloheptanicus]